MMKIKGLIRQDEREGTVELLIEVERRGVVQTYQHVVDSVCESEDLRGAVSRLLEVAANRLQRDHNTKLVGRIVETEYTVQEL